MRFVASYMTENDCDWLELSIKSVVDIVDKVYVIYSPTDADNTEEMVKQFGDKIELIKSQYAHESLGADGMQRNKYLEVLKEKEMDSWCLVLDSDEVVDDRFESFVNNIKKSKLETQCIGNIRMVHMFGNFATEDNQAPIHYVPRRLFKVCPTLKYTNAEHSMLYTEGEEYPIVNVDEFVIFHFSDVKHMMGLKKKYKNQLSKSEIHTPGYLRWWYESRLYGYYPTGPFPPHQLPNIVKKEFFIDE